MVRFLILAAQRTGSTVLGDALDQHPQVSCEREMFLEGQKRPRSYARFLASSRWRRAQARLAPRRALGAYLEGFFRGEPPLRAVGMKLMYNQRSALIDRWIETEQPHLVHLVRHNAVKVIVSRLTAEARGIYHVERGGALPEGAIAIPTEKVLAELEKLEQSVAAQREWLGGKRHLEVSYEDLIAEPAPLFDRLHAFLGVAPAPPPPLPLQKVNPDSVAATIANHAELADRLRGTRFATQLD